MARDASASESVGLGTAKVSPMPVLAAAIVSRSGRCSSAQLSRKATAATQAATMNTVERALVNAVR